ncbi:AAA family ATPase [Cryomorphaceae bacterium 1068]|nr:AAA family ATPase [Cryomorphaceae bacterium 1068]
MKKVFLIGYMGVGKTTLGKRIANSMRLPFYDLDKEIVRMDSRLIKEIFVQSGELHFREVETRILKDFCNRKESFVLSTGGGAATSIGNMESMKDSGVVVWLDMSVDKILSRLAQGEDRPLLEGFPEEKRQDFIKTHLAERVPHYRKAHIRFDSTNVNAEKLEHLVKEIHSK